jgi:hypothetical protein
MAWLNNFSVVIPESSELAGGYAELQHAQQYSLRLRNSRSTACDAKIEIDGKDVGTFRVYPFASITIERPAHDQSRFTFYKVGSGEARQAQLNESDPNLGLVKVTFMPELAVKPLPTVYVSQVGSAAPWKPTATWTSSVDYNNVTASLSTDSFGDVAMAAMPQRRAGGTGLSGHSNQNFNTVAPLNYDQSQMTTIFLRLVFKSESPKPLTSYSTQVPPRID